MNSIVAAIVGDDGAAQGDAPLVPSARNTQGLDRHAWQRVATFVGNYSNDYGSWNQGEASPSPFTTRPSMTPRGTSLTIDGFAADESKYSTTVSAPFAPRNPRREIVRLPVVPFTAWNENCPPVPVKARSTFHGSRRRTLGLGFSGIDRKTTVALGIGKPLTEFTTVPRIEIDCSPGVWARPDTECRETGHTDAHISQV